MGIGDSFNKLVGKTRFVVARIFIHLQGQEIAPLLGILNQAAREAVESDGDLEVMGESLVNICEALLQYQNYWYATANEGDVFWDEGDAGDYFTELFTDSAQRYLSQPDLESPVGENEPLFLPVTNNLIVMITVAFEGEVPDIETDLAEIEALDYALKALINLNYQNKYRGIQVHFSPAKLGDELNDEQILLNFSELVPL
jgi:hypothetical protein